MTAPDGERTVGGKAAGDVSGAGATDLQPDVERLHRAVLREPSDPQEGREPMPWWFVLTIVLALFWGGWYLGRYGGEFSTASHLAFAARQPGIAAAAASQSAAAVTDPVAAGQAIWRVTRHQTRVPVSGNARQIGVRAGCGPPPGTPLRRLPAWPM